MNLLMFLQTAYPAGAVPSLPSFAVVGPTSTPCSMPPCGSGGSGGLSRCMGELSVHRYLMSTAFRYFLTGEVIIFLTRRSVSDVQA